MLAPIVGVDGQQVATHLTFLKKDGVGKADLGRREFQRECRGALAGGAIRLIPY